MLQPLLDAIGFGLCHQIPASSFFGGGTRLPVCVRDTGIYVGFTVALVMLSLLHRDRPQRVPPLWVNALLGLGVLAMAVDGFSSTFGIRTTTNELRLLTGLFTGYAIAAWIMPIVSGEVWQRAGGGRVLGDPKKFALFALSLPLTYAFIWWIAPLLGVVYPLAATAAILITFTTVSLVMVSLLPPFNRRAQRYRDALPALGVAVVLAVAVLAASNILKTALLTL